MLLKRVLLLLTITLFSNLLATDIDKINFSGNNHFPDKVLVDILTIAEGDSLDYSLIKGNPQLIYNFYRDNGYPFVKVSQPLITPLTVDKVIVDFTIQESALNSITKITFKGNLAIKSKIFHELLSSQNIGITDLGYLKQLVLDEYTKRSYFFAQVNLYSMTETDSGAEVVISIQENRPFRYNYTKFKGNIITQEKTIMKISKLNQFSEISPETLQECESRVLEKEYFSECSIYPIDYETLMVEVKETKMTNITGILGYNNSNADNPMTGFVDFKFDNLFGSDRAIKFKWNRLQNDKSYLELAYHDSGLSNYYLSSDIGMKRTEYDTLSNLSELSASLNYEYYSQQFGVIFGFSSYDVTSTYLEEDSEIIRNVGLFWKSNRFNNPKNPTSGDRFKVSLTYNKSSLDEQSYNTTTISYGTVFKLLPKTILFTKLNSNYSTKEELSKYNDFKLGGFSTLRGFQEEQFSGYLTIWANSELRYLFGARNNLFIFTDSGYVEKREDGYRDKKGNLYSAGLGLRIATKLGNLTFVYGLGYNDGWNSMYDGLVHFGLETSF